MSIITITTMVGAITTGTGINPNTMAKGLKMAAKMKPAGPPKDKRAVSVYQPEVEDRNNE